MTVLGKTLRLRDIPGGSWGESGEMKEVDMRKQDLVKEVASKSNMSPRQVKI